MISGSLSNNAVRLIVTSRNANHQNETARCDRDSAYGQAKNPRLKSRASDVFKPEYFGIAVDLEGNETGWDARFGGHTDNDVPTSGVRERGDIGEILARVPIRIAIGVALVLNVSRL